MTIQETQQRFVSGRGDENQLLQDDVISELIFEKSFFLILSFTVNVIPSNTTISKIFSSHENQEIILIFDELTLSLTKIWKQFIKFNSMKALRKKNYLINILRKKTKFMSRSTKLSF